MKLLSAAYTDVVNIGSKTYKVDLQNGSLYSKFNKKVYVYPDGKYQVVYANSRVFKVPLGYKSLDSDRKLFECRYSSEPMSEEASYRSQRKDNLYRAISRMQQIVRCNSFDYFVTLTFNDKKVNGADPEIVRAKASRWLSNLVARKNAAYLLVPEYHKSGRIHFHALIKGDLDLTFDDVYIVDGYDKPLKASTIAKKRIPADKIRCKVYNVSGWKYGFSTAIEIYGDGHALSNYMSKYMTKDIHKIFGHYYWTSRNLQLYPLVMLSNSYDYYKIPSKEYTHGACDIRFKYVNRLGASVTDDLD